MQKRGVARGDLDGLETPLVPYPPLGLDLTPTPWGEPSPSQGGGMASEWSCK